ncbi:hypothetical protein ILUMI_19657 [Ignelater luminosus]|uniref:Uncharacterized protein n=1 Tax=Ignelater luminosus TaxID=2038154 RepID=A0A8K0CLA0_IGNLU|nr:hypothetical protein ILUMI_19657 [Ignelater luminosus]
MSWISDHKPGESGILENLNSNENRLDAEESDADSGHSDHMTDSKQLEVKDELENSLLERKAHDNLVAITEVLDELISKSKENYQDDEYFIVDEMIEPFRGQNKSWIPDTEPGKSRVLENRLDAEESDTESKHSDHPTDPKQSQVEDEHEINVRRRKHNIVIRLPGENAACVKIPLDCWNLFFLNSITKRIVQHANCYLNKLRVNYGQHRDMAGVKKVQHLNVKNLWTSDGSDVECIRSTMSRERFLLPFTSSQV